MTEIERLRPVKQVLIAAGGFGTRMGEYLYPAKCKSLMVYRGKTMIEWLLNNLEAAGIEECVVATNNHCNEEVSAVLKSQRDTSIHSIIVPPEGFRKIPHYVKKALDDRFLYVCGHHPLPITHIQALVESATHSELSITAYDNTKYTMDKTKRYIVDDPSSISPVIKSVDMSVQDIPAEHFYIRNPYVVSMEAVNAAEEDNFQQSFSHYVFEQDIHKRNMSVVTADMPPEFDYPEEYQRTKQFLGTLVVAQQRDNSRLD